MGDTSFIPETTQVVIRDRGCRGEAAPRPLWATHRVATTKVLMPDQVRHDKYVEPCADKNESGVKNTPESIQATKERRFPGVA